MNQEVDDTERDQILKTLKMTGDNDKCFDCQQQNTKWASISFGLFLCFDCSGKHRGYGPSISFVRSLTLDSWNRQQILALQLGGNRKAQEYFRKNGLVVGEGNKSLEYQSSDVQKYKQELSRLIESELVQLFPSSAPIQSAPKPIIINTPKQEQKSEPPKDAPAPVTETKQQDFFANNLVTNTKAISTNKVVFNTEKSNNNTVQGVKGQKIQDIDFDRLVFDDGIDTSSTVTKPTTQSVNQTQFQLYEEQQMEEKAQNNSGNGIGFNSGNTSSSFSSSSNNNNNQTPNQTMEKFQKENVKAISSASFFTEQTSDKDKQSFQQFNGQQSISSKDFYGEPDQPSPDSGSSGMETVQNFFSFAGEKLYDLQEKTSDLVSKVKDNWK